MPRIDMSRTSRLAYAAVMGLEAYSRTHIDKHLYELIKLRASILNGCGYCVDMHATDGAEAGIPQRKLHAVGAWQHSRSLFDARELAVLALTDASRSSARTRSPTRSGTRRPRTSTRPVSAA